MRKPSDTEIEKFRKEKKEHIEHDREERENQVTSSRSPFYFWAAATSALYLASYASPEAATTLNNILTEYFAVPHNPQMIQAAVPPLLSGLGTAIFSFLKVKYHEAIRGHILDEAAEYRFVKDTCRDMLYEKKKEQCDAGIMDWILKKVRPGRATQIFELAGSEGVPYKYEEEIEKLESKLKDEQKMNDKLFRVLVDAGFTYASVIDGKIGEHAQSFKPITGLEKGNPLKIKLDNLRNEEVEINGKSFRAYSFPYIEGAYVVILKKTKESDE